MMETGQSVSKVICIFILMRADGTYINEDARIVCEKIVELENQRTTSMEISPNNSLGQVFWKRTSRSSTRCGRWSLCPSQIFGSSNPRFGGFPTSTNCFQELKIELQKLKSEIETKNGNMKQWLHYLFNSYKIHQCQYLLNFLMLYNNKVPVTIIPHQMLTLVNLRNLLKFVLYLVLYF